MVLDDIYTFGMKVVLDELVFYPQEHWSCGSADAASAYLQAGGIERLLLLMIKTTTTTRM